jgi:hypothetical protein
MLAGLRHIQSQEEDEREYGRQREPEPTSEPSEPKSDFDPTIDFPELRMPPEEPPKRTSGPVSEEQYFVPKLAIDYDSSYARPMDSSKVFKPGKTWIFCHGETNI